MANAYWFEAWQHNNQLSSVVIARQKERAIHLFDRAVEAGRGPGNKPIPENATELSLFDTNGVLIKHHYLKHEGRDDG